MVSEHLYPITFSEVLQYSGEEVSLHFEPVDLILSTVKLYISNSSRCCYTLVYTVLSMGHIAFV
jgi:hypothetical protein